MKKVVVVALATIAILLAAGGSWWAFGYDREVRSTGRCDQTAYRLVSDRDDGGPQLSYELRSGAPGETWQVRIQQGGNQIYDGVRTTDEDGEFDMDVTVDENAASRFRVDATRTGTQSGTTRSGTCSATLTR